MSQVMDIIPPAAHVETQRRREAAERFQRDRCAAIRQSLRRLGFHPDRIERIAPIIDRIERLEWVSAWPVESPEEEHGDLLGALRAADVIGDLVGRGGSRDIYELKGCPELVLKVHVRLPSYSNVWEMAIWRSAQTLKLGRWLAPCVWLDPSGRMLVQRRTLPLLEAVWADLCIPDVLVSKLRSDWGLLDGRPVTHDYCEGCFDTPRFIGADVVRLRSVLEHDD